MNKKTVFLILIFLGISSIAVLNNIPTAKAIIWIQGHITSDTTWMPVDTYRVIGDTYVDPGVTLTIQAGVHIQFADGFSLVVDGTLYSLGTEDNPILFTSSKISPLPGSWSGIEFRGAGNQSFIMEHSIMEYAKSGIKNVGDGRIEIRLSEIRSCSLAGVELQKGKILLDTNRLYNNKYGVTSYLMTNLSNVTISGNSIAENNVGIYLDGVALHNITIRNNRIYSNGGSGFWVNLPNEVSDLKICDNDIHHNGDLAIKGWVHYDPIINFSIRNNSIYSNKGGIDLDVSGRIFGLTIIGNTITQSSELDGISISYCPWEPGGESTTLIITNNWITSNQRDGIRIYSWAHPDLVYEVCISNNSISDNTRGIYFYSLTTEAKVSITYNSISNNTLGIELSTTMDNSVWHNDIFENTEGMKVSEGASANAENNYWGHTTGPYHGSINPEGQGNSVNGNGVDLDFVPFLPEKVDPIIPEFPLFIILPVFMMATLLVVTFCKRKHII